MTFDRETVMKALNLESRRDSPVLWSFGLAIVGAAIGAAVALLLAPKKGTELRQDLMRQAKALLETKNGASSTQTSPIASA